MSGRRSSWDIEMPAVPASLDPVQDMVSEMYDTVEDDLDAADRIRFESALVEIVANVIEHGRPTGAGGPLTMRVSVARDGRDLLGIVTDDGVPADVDLDRACMTGTDDVSGRGLAMALALSSELRYERSDGRNRWMVKRTCS